MVTFPCIKYIIVVTAAVLFFEPLYTFYAIPPMQKGIMFHIRTTVHDYMKAGIKC